MSKKLFYLICSLFALCLVVFVLIYSGQQKKYDIVVDRLNTAIAITSTPLKPTATITPTFTLTPTKTLVPTKTPTPQPNYILETGFCIMRVDPGTQDPKTVSGCGQQTREQVYLDDSIEITVSFNKMVNEVQWYCAIYTLDGQFVMSDIDRTASGNATCYIHK
jgi:hypothetical protein